jgi:hypothetical protein
MGSDNVLSAQDEACQADRGVGLCWELESGSREDQSPGSSNMAEGIQ